MINQLKNKGIFSFAGLALIGGLIAFLPFNAQAEEGSFTEAQKTEIEGIFSAYLMENPDIIMKAISAQQARQQEEKDRKAAAVLEEIMPDLLNGKAPTAGNPEGDVTIVEFFDYNCGYCKKALKDIQSTISSDEGVNFVFKEMPILGPTSLTAAKWALAAHKQDKYFEYHIALMEHKGPKNESELSKLAKKIGLDVDQMKKDANSKEVADHVAEDLAAARSLGINGTPAFIIDGEIKSGYLGLNGLKAAIADARDK